MRGMAPMGILTAVDAFALGRYCTLLARWIVAKDFIERASEIVDGRAGALVAARRHPYAEIFLSIPPLLLRLEQEFGLTPSARSSFGTPPGDEPPLKGKGKSRFFSG
jgi:P27 family predicted phage terminase small subunit